MISIMRESGKFSDSELSRADDLLFAAARASRVSEVAVAARDLFAIISPNADLHELMTSRKSLHELKLTREDAVRGIHAARAWMARMVENVRRRSYPCDSTVSIEYNINGIACVRNFMGSDKAEHLSKLIKTAPVSTAKNSSNLVRHHVDETAKACLHEIRPIVIDCLAVSNDHAETDRQLATNTFFQRVKNVPGDGDVQKVSHQDTYFSALKFWYFPDEVTIEDGPLAYVPRSHLLYRERLNFIHAQSLAFYDNVIEKERTYGHAEGSLRALESDLQDMDLVEKVMVVPTDTLVIANVFGFHRRAEATRECVRDSIHGSIRFERPFDE